MQKGRKSTGRRAFRRLYDAVMHPATDDGLGPDTYVNGEQPHGNSPGSGVIGRRSWDQRKEYLDLVIFCR